MIMTIIIFIITISAMKSLGEVLQIIQIIIIRTIISKPSNEMIHKMVQVDFREEEISALGLDHAAMAIGKTTDMMIAHRSVMIK